MADDVASRVRGLERLCRLQGFALVGLAALSAASWAFPRRSATVAPVPESADDGETPAILKAGDVVAKRIVAKRIEIWDPEGKPLATLAGDGGFGTLELKTDRGGWKTTVVASGLTCVNGRGQTRAGLAAGDTGYASLFLRDEDGEEAVSISGGDGSSASFLGARGQGVLQFGVRGDEPHMEYRAGSDRGRFEKVLP